MSSDPFNLMLEIVMRLAKKEGSNTDLTLDSRPVDRKQYRFKTQWQTIGQFPFR